MNKKRIMKHILIGILLILSCVWLLSKIPFQQNIEQQIPANAYQNGESIGTETISMDGSKTSHLFTGEHTFFGKIHIPSAEQTASETLQFQIFWDKTTAYQQMICLPKPGVVTTPETLGLVPCILINKSMTHFALMLTDGTIIATSDDLQALYQQHITWNNDTGHLSVTGQLPILD